MTFRLRVFFLVLCTRNFASGVFLPECNLFRDSSTVIHLKCAIFSPVVRLFPLRYPKIEEVLFELRAPCKRTEHAVSQAKKLLDSPHFNKTRKTVIVVTGWNSEMNEDYTESLTKAYLCRGGPNFIVVNTSDFIKTEYINSAYSTEKLGQFIAVGLKNLNIPGKNIHIIGHSLGAHIAGSAGRQFAAETGEKIGRITGLDPARPCFIEPLVFPRLTKTDATFVDVIHSNPGETGTEEAIGHADFYSGGLKSTKPGCFALDLGCSHIRSIDYYTESVYRGNENNFMGSLCNDYQQLTVEKCSGTKEPMGFSAKQKTRGIYLLEVNTKAPYGKNAKGDAYLSLNKCGVCSQ